MEVIENLDCFGGRLYDSFKEKGYDLKSDNGNNSPAMKHILADMIDKGLITEDETETFQRKIRKDIKDSSAFPGINTLRLKLYCDFLQVSADYLLGFIEKPLSDTGLSTKAITKLKNMDSDSKELVNDMLEGRYIKKMASDMRTFYAIGNSIQIRSDNPEDEKKYGKKIEAIRIDTLRDSGADFIHKLAYDKKVFKHFMSNAVDVHNQKEMELEKELEKRLEKEHNIVTPADYLERMQQRQAEFKDSMLAIYDEIETAAAKQ